MSFRSTKSLSKLANALLEIIKHEAYVKYTPELTKVMTAIIHRPTPLLETLINMHLLVHPDRDADELKEQFSLSSEGNYDDQLMLEIHDIRIITLSLNCLDLTFTELLVIEFSDEILSKIEEMV